MRHPCRQQIPTQFTKLPGGEKGISIVSNAESLVIVRLGRNNKEAPIVFEVLEQVGLLGEVYENEMEMVEPGAVGFRIPRDRMVVAVLALECNGFADVKAYEVQPSYETRTRKEG